MDTPEKASVVIEFIRSLEVAPVMLIAMLGSMASYIHGVANKGKSHSWLAMFSQLLASGLSGLIVFNIGKIMALDPNTVSILAGISGWAGVRTMEFFEATVKKMATQYVVGRQELDRRETEDPNHK